MTEEDKKETMAKDGGHTDDIESLKKQLAECESKRDEYLAGWQRAKADFSNYKKDEWKRFEEVTKLSNEEFIKELLTVIDNFDLGLAALEKSGTVEKGIYLIRGQIEDILRRHSVKKLPSGVDKNFDPATQEAVGELESDKPPGTVIEEISAGYEYYNKLIRPARVRIAKSKSS